MRKKLPGWKHSIISYARDLPPAEQLNDLQEKQQQTSGFLKEKAEYAPMFEESQGILADLKNLMEAERKEQEYRQQVITWTAAIPQLEKSLISKEKDLQEKDQASAALQKEIDQQTKSWEAFNTPDCSHRNQI